VKPQRRCRGFRCRGFEVEGGMTFQVQHASRDPPPASWTSWTRVSASRSLSVVRRSRLNAYPKNDMLGQGPGVCSSESFNFGHTVPSPIGKYSTSLRFQRCVHHISTCPGHSYLVWSLFALVCVCLAAPPVTYPPVPPVPPSHHCFLATRIPEHY
jgi:hypothetical protein